MTLAARVSDLASRIAVEFRTLPTPAVAVFTAALDFGNLGAGAPVFAGEVVLRRMDFSRGGSRIDLGAINA